MWFSEKNFNEGYNEVSVDGLNTAGLYIYTLETGNVLRTKKMNLKYDAIKEIMDLSMAEQFGQPCFVIGSTLI